ncbi:hypothetical protein CVV68_07130 [Arthrobacter livingstonensis]|uniref:Uncharacterized protein n=1 Tax=Arthrobacter livingstonensis TaxID=670078 RepID=A0A2V5LC38_9MICC|nr:AAA family ATPase [Arthrobacter livingstonensis]PYI68104.1 hypothetical protein CVV68_07130 [Arthrobacter livingstonensis]
MLVRAGACEWLGKVHIAGAHFLPFEVLSSDFFRGLVSNDESDQSAKKAAFESLNFVAGRRLDVGLLTVVDATNVRPDARRELVQLARDQDILPVAVVLDVPEEVCLRRDELRDDRILGTTVIRRRHDQLRHSLKSLRREGFRTVHVFRGEVEIAAASFRRDPLLDDFTGDDGPLDVIGDVDASHAQGRRAVFVGDLVNRGPDIPGVLRLLMGMVRGSHARAVPVNREDKLVRALKGRKVRGRPSPRVQSFAVYGDMTGETDHMARRFRYAWVWATGGCHGPLGTRQRWRPNG